MTRPVLVATIILAVAGMAAPILIALFGFALMG